MPNAPIDLPQNPFEGAASHAKLTAYAPQQEALAFLKKTFAQSDRPIAILSGDDGIGKTTVATHFAETAAAVDAVANVDGEGLYASQLLTKILYQFGYDVSLSSTEELLNLLQVFLVQQAQSGASPLLIVDNLERMSPGALSALCQIAAFGGVIDTALRMILVGNAGCHAIINSPSMAPIAERIGGSYEMRPMAKQECQRYLFAKLQGAGVARPDDVLPVTACDAIFEQSGGLPLQVDQAAARYLARDTGKSAAPRLIVSRDGGLLLDVELVANRLLIGRSELCDVLLSDQFVSKYHALIIWNEEVVILVDLKSSNGTYVNSRRTQTRVLHHNDVISMGDHRIKVLYEQAGSADEIGEWDIADTSKMKSIADARRARALRNVGLRIVDTNS